jgi:hypothetical protein
MIKLVFTINRETIVFEVENKIVVYKDRRFPKGITILPKNKKEIIFSRNRIPKEIVLLIDDSNSGKNFEEYKNSNDDFELSEIIKRDASLKGCLFQKKIEVL